MSSRLGPHTIDAAALADELVRFRVADPDRLTDLLAEFPGGGPAALAEYLVARRVLTPFQADLALAGEARLIALGPYRVVAPGGYGTFGPVLVASCGKAGEAYRLRVFPLRSLWRARQAGQLARSLSAPPHPAVVPLADAGSANGFHYLAWPLADGATLADRVAATGPLPPREAAALLARLADALAACHARGVAHGALTPACVLITPDGGRLLDLGAGAVLAANLADDESMLDTMSAAVAAGGVLEYAAPEFDADPVPSPAADQYALGAVGYFALCGRPPFDGKTLADRLAAKLAGPPGAANPAVPPALAAAVGRMLRPSPADRFADLAEVRDAIGTAAGTPSIGSVDFELSEPPAEPAGTPALAETRPPTAPDLSAVSSPPPASPAPPGPPPRHRRPTPESPAPDGPIMAKPPRVGTSDPRHGVETPFLYHTHTPPASAALPPSAPPSPDADRPPEESVLWRRVRRNLLFWRAPTDVVQVSVFGPPAVTPGEAAKVSVYLHTPEAARSVRTLSRAFHHNAELIGTGYVTRAVARESRLAVHLSAANAGVSKSLVEFAWRGPPQQLVFDLHVPWEAPGGPAPGLVSVGRGDVRIGKIEFRLNILPRRG